MVSEGGLAPWLTSMVKLFRSLTLWLCASVLAVHAWAGTQAVDVATLTGRGDQLPVESAMAASRWQAPGPAWAETQVPLAWQAQRLGVRTLGFEPRATWVRSKVRNAGQQTRMAWLLVTDAYTDHVDCFVSSPGMATAVHRMGDTRPFSDRPVPSFAKYLIPLSLQPGQEAMVHCLIDNNGTKMVFFQYWEPQAFADRQRAEDVKKAWCYGALAFAVLFAMALSLMQRNALSTLMLVELLPVLFAIASREGDSFQWVWPDFPALNLPPYAVMLSGIFAVALTFHWVLPLRKVERWVINAVASLAGGACLLVMAMPNWGPQINHAAQISVVFVSAAILGVCLCHWRDGAFARLLSLSLLIQLLGLAVNGAGTLGLLNERQNLATLYASVAKAFVLGMALVVRMRQDRRERAKALQDHNAELERRLHYEAQLRHAVSHHPRYGMPNQTMLEAAIEQTSREPTSRAVSLWIIKLNRFGFLESILPPATLTDMVKAYAAELSAWLQQQDGIRMLDIEPEQRVAALDDGTLAFALQGPVNDALQQALLQFVTRRFEAEGLFVAWDPHVGFTRHGSPHDGAQLCDEARIALQWCSAHQRVVPFDAERMKREQLAYGLTLDLEGAIERGELLLHYQPKVTLLSGQTDSLEALVRWRHPDRGLIPPGAFIAEAEATGAINRLTMWAIDEAARFMGTLMQSHVRVSVNITAFDLATPHFVDKVLATLAARGCDPGRLILEVTESAALSDPDRASHILARLREQGVRIALDDFGTGYSSLGLLQSMPLDELKVDRSFVTNMLGFDRKQAVLQSMIDVGHRLGLSVTIEGVEDIDAVKWLSGHGCDVVQGFVFSRPLEGAAARQWLDDKMPRPWA